MLLLCNETVTLIQHIKGTDADTYKCTVCEGASWYKKTTITTSAEGARPTNTYEVRIMGGENITPALGDYMALGVVNAVEKPADLKGVDHFRITAIGDNKRGRLAHWRCSGQ